MTLTKVILLLILPLFSRTVIADELVGHVLVVGSSINMRVELTAKGQSTGPALCSNEVAKRIRKLLRLEVSVTGDWRMKKDGKTKDCLWAEDFKILRHSSGRPPFIGLLQDEGSHFVIKGDDGKSSKLSGISSGLKKLKGKKLILDLKPMDAPGQKDVSFKVVSYSEYPE